MQSHRVIQPHVFEPPALKAAAARRPPLKMPGSWWLWLILLALLLPGIYFISSVWVRIQIEPPADEYSVSGLGSLVLADGFLALPGRSYQVKASKKGYQPLQTLYTASPADSQLFSARLEPLAGIIAIQSSPPGAEISLDAKPLGVSPLTKTDIPQGRYQLQASLPLYKPYQQQISVRGLGLTDPFKLTLQPDWGLLQLSVKTAHAQLFIDGKPLQTWPEKIKLQADVEHQIQVSAAGFQSWQKTLHLAVGEQVQFTDIELQAAKGRLLLESKPAGANVVIDDVYRGQTPLTLSVTPEVTHRLLLSKAGFKSHSSEFSVRPDEKSQQSIRLKPVYAQLRLRVSPASAQLYVNGKAMKHNKTLTLQALPQRLEVRLKGYRSWKKTVTVREGIDQSLQVTLQALKKGASGATASAKKARTAPYKPIVKSSDTAPDGSRLQRFTGGRFEMGAKHGQQGRRANEYIRKVRISKAFPDYP